MINSPPPTAHIFVDASSYFIMQAVPESCRRLDGVSGQNRWFDILLKFSELFNAHIYFCGMTVFDVSGILPNKKDIDIYFSHPSGSPKKTTPISNKAFFTRAINREFPRVHVIHPTRHEKSNNFLAQLMGFTTDHPNPLPKARTELTKLQAKKPSNSGDWATLSALSDPQFHKNGNNAFLIADDGDMGMNSVYSNFQSCNTLNVSGFVNAVLQPGLGEAMGLNVPPDSERQSAIEQIHIEAHEQVLLMRELQTVPRFSIIDTDIGAPELNLWRGAFRKWTEAAMAFHKIVAPQQTPTAIASGADRFKSKFGNGSAAYSFGGGKAARTRNPR